MLAGKKLLDYTNLFSPNDYKKNNKIMYKYCKDKYGRRGTSRLRKTDETRNYLLYEIKHKDLMKKSIRRHVSI